MEASAVEGDDAGGFLAAVLERMQAESGQRRRVRMVIDAEDAAFLVQLVGLAIEARHLAGRSVLIRLVMADLQRLRHRILVV